VQNDIRYTALEIAKFKGKSEIVDMIERKLEELAASPAPTLDNAAEGGNLAAQKGEGAAKEAPTPPKER
jgi:hypothetical protein